MNILVGVEFTETKLVYRKLIRLSHLLGFASLLECIYSLVGFYAGFHQWCVCVN